MSGKDRRPGEDGWESPAENQESGANQEASGERIPQEPVSPFPAPDPENDAAAAGRLQRLVRTAGEAVRGKGLSRALIAAAVVLVAMGLWSLMLWSVLEKAPEQVEESAPVGSPALDAEQYGASGSVYLRNADYLDLIQVREGLRITPGTTYQLFQGEESGSYEIKLMEPGTRAYTITFADPVTGEVSAVQIGTEALVVSLVDLNPDYVSVNQSLTLEFNDKVAYEDLREALSITPETSYYMEYAGGYVYNIIPESRLEYETAYTLTIRGGLENEEGTSALGEDQAITFRTQREDFQVLLTNRSAQTLSTGEPLELEFDMGFGSPITADKTVDWSYQDRGVALVLELYRFPSMERYLTQSAILMNYNVPLTMLELVDVDALVLEKGLNAHTVGNPGLGGYLLRASLTHPETGEEIQFRRAFTVTDLSVYAHTNGSHTLVWVNSSATGGAVEGYTAEFYKDSKGEAVVSALTGGDGVATMNYVDEDRDEGGYVRNPARILTLRDGGGQVAYVDNTSVLNRYGSLSGANRYYAFFHTDRTLYQPTDEINFWGFIRPYRLNPDPMPSTAKIILGEGSLDQEVEVEIGEDGTFSGTLDLDAVRSSPYQLAFKLPGEEEGEPLTPGAARREESPDVTVRSIYLQIKEYEKPTYVINSQVDKEFYLPGEEVTVTITPSFYDGTPMPEYELEFQAFSSYTGDVGYTTRVTTDSQGSATVTMPGDQRPGEESTGWTPSTGRYLVRITGDGENITHYGTYTYLPTHILFDGNFREEAGNLSLELGAYEIDAEKLTEETIALLRSPYESSLRASSADSGMADIAGEPREMELLVSLEYACYDTDGERHYGQVEETVATVNGAVTLEHLLDLPEGLEWDSTLYTYFYGSVSGLDGAGRRVVGSLSWYSGEYYGSYHEYDQYQGFHFAVTDNAGENKLGQFTPYMSYNEATFGDGETIRFQLLRAEEPVEEGGRLLYTINQDGLVERGIVNGTSLQLTQSVELANSFNLIAAYFDGTTVYPIRNTVINFLRSSAALQVEVAPGQETYQPGGEARLSVRVTDREGNGVRGSVIVGVVDESVFDLQEQTVEVLDSLYRGFFFSHYDVRKYTTSTGDYDDTLESGKGDGGKGGEGDLSFLENLRKNFRDTALFQQARTDASGNATLTFTLPDNVTSWRVTSAAVGDNLYGGQSTTNFITTMPFFLKPVLSSKYIEGDDVAMLVQAHGVALDGESEIDYMVNITGDGVDETRIAQNLAYQSAEINFGKLPAGEYIVTAVASTEGYSDAVELTVAVISSNLELVVNRELDLSQPLDIAAMRYPVTISFYDREYEAYYKSLSSLLTHYCEIANQRLARYVAKQRLSAYLDPDEVPQHIRAGDNDLQNLQNEDGGVGWYAGTTSDFRLTAKVALIAKDQFDLDAMAEYFRGIIEEYSSPVRNTSGVLVPITVDDWEYVAAGYLGLAHIGEPVLEEIYPLVENPGASVYEMAYLTAALAYAGDEERALEEYEKHIVPHLKKGPGGWWLEIEDPEDDDLNNRITAMSWIAASRLGLEDADQYSRYFSQSSWRISTLLECMVYVVNYDKEVAPTSFPYTVEGRVETLDLGISGQQTLVFNRSQLETLALEQVPDNVSATAYYIGEPEEADIHPSELIEMEKDIINLGNRRYRVVVTIRFAEEAPEGQYDVSEWIPSNMRLYAVESEGDSRTRSLRHSTEGQKIYFTIDRKQGQEEIQLQYTATRTYESEAVVDSTYIIHGESGENNLTPRTTLDLG